MLLSFSCATRQKDTTIHILLNNTSGVHLIRSAGLTRRSRVSTDKLTAGKRRDGLCAEECVRVGHLGQFVAALVLVKRRHGRLGWRAVQPLGPALHRVLRRPSLCDEQCQEDEELLRVVLKELLRCICTKERDRGVRLFLFTSLSI